MEEHESSLSLADVTSLVEQGDAPTLYKPLGCSACFNTGFSGRTGAFELMTANRNIRQLIARAAPVQEIRQAALRAGMLDLRRSVLLKIAQGEFSAIEGTSGTFTDLAE
jgi:type II secretory ATPase GspE/PulE/Tfp pilus assembly ATPase PilB-like protein